MTCTRRPSRSEPPLLETLPTTLLDRLPQPTVRFDPISKIVVEKLLWSAETDSIAEYLNMAKTATIDRYDIGVPTRCTAGTSDPEEAVRQTHDDYEALPNEPKGRTIYGLETDVDVHCLLDDPEPAYATDFDRFDETLSYSSYPS